MTRRSARSAITYKLSNGVEQLATIQTTVATEVKLKHGLKSTKFVDDYGLPRLVLLIVAVTTIDCLQEHPEFLAQTTRPWTGRTLKLRAS